MNKLFFASLMILLLQPQSALAYGELHDEYTLELKGYSVEMNDAIQAVVDRMEGRQPPPPPTHKEQMKYNFWNNDWANAKEPFTYDRIDPPKYPKRQPL